MVPSSAPNCPFCAIIAGREAGIREVYRTGEVVAFFPTDPATLGHTLVVPTRHVETITELTETEVGTLASASARLARWVEQELRPEGLNVIQSNGAVAEQTVPHVHVHIVPRWQGDAIGPIWLARTDFAEEAKEAVWCVLAARALSEERQR